MNVIDALHEWQTLQKQIDNLKFEQRPLTEQIERETLLGGHDYQLGEQVIAKWSAGRGRYDWAAIGGVLKHDHNLSKSVIESHSKITVNWRAACTEVGYPDSLAEKHYTPGTPSVRIKLLDGGDS